jgi:hypothetical protein
LALAEPPQEVRDEIARLIGRTQALGDVSEFGLFVARSIETNDCRDLLVYISPNSEYFEDPEYFYANCLYNSRRFRELDSYQIGRLSFQVQRPDGLPPLIPVITILYGEGGNGDKIDLRLDLEADKFLLLDMKFLYGGPNSYVPPK